MKLENRLEKYGKTKKGVSMPIVEYTVKEIINVKKYGDDWYGVIALIDCLGNERIYEINVKGKEGLDRIQVGYVGYN